MECQATSKTVLKAKWEVKVGGPGSVSGATVPHQEVWVNEKREAGVSRVKRTYFNGSGLST